MSERKLKTALALDLVPEGPCPDGETLYRFASGSLEGGAYDAVDAHLLTCPSCMETWRDLRSLRAYEPEEKVVAMPVRRSRSPVTRWAMAAAFALLLIGGAWVTVQWRLALNEADRLSGSRPGIVLDLMPRSLAVRGAEGIVLDRGEGSGPWVLVFNPLEAHEGAASAEILGPGGEIVRSHEVTMRPEAPPAIVVPRDLLTAGDYEVVLKDAATSAEIDRFPFAVQ